MAVSKPKDLPTGGVDPKAFVVGAAMVAWTANYAAFKAFGTPWPYCFVQATLGPLLSGWFDGLRAILFVAVLVGLFTLKLKWVVGLIGFMVLNLMVPGIVATLFSFGHSCAPPPPPPVAVAEKTPVVPARPKPAPKATPKAKQCPSPYTVFPPEPVDGCPEWVGPRPQQRQFY